MIVTRSSPSRRRIVTPTPCSSGSPLASTTTARPSRERRQLVDERLQPLGPRAPLGRDLAGNEPELAVAADEQVGCPHGLARALGEARPAVCADADNGDHAVKHAVRASGVDD